MKFYDFYQPGYPLNFYSAFPDLKTAHIYVEEFYKVHCPILKYKEIDRSNSYPHEDLAELWNEQVGGLKIGREIDIHMYPDYDVEEKQVHKKHGTEIERECRFSFGILELIEVDLYPEMGDHIMFGGYDYEIMRVYVRPSDIWQQTNQPLHISTDCVIYRPGDRKFKEGSKKI